MICKEDIRTRWRGGPEAFDNRKVRASANAPATRDTSTAARAAGGKAGICSLVSAAFIGTEQNPDDFVE